MKIQGVDFCHPQLVILLPLSLLVKCGLFDACCDTSTCTMSLRLYKMTILRDHGVLTTFQLSCILKQHFLQDSH